MKEISILNKSILLDDEDFMLVNNSKIVVHNFHRENTPYISIYDKVSHKTNSLHRLIMKAKKGEIVDHINHNVFDNRKCNLRICNVSENSRNRNKKSCSPHKYKGIYMDKNYNKTIYRAEIRVNTKKICIGSFDRPELAALAYDIFALDFFGKFAYLNFPHLTQTN